MKLRTKLLFAVLVCPLLTPISIEAAFWNKKKKDKEEVTSKSSYEKLTEGKLKSSGMFNIYLSEDEYYFEIPDSLLGRDILILNRLTKVPKELNEAGVNRGVNYEHEMIRFEKDRSGKNLNIRQQRVNPESPAGDAITRSVLDNYVSPLKASFKIEAYNADSTKAVIKVTDYFNGKETALNNVFSSINLGTSARNELSGIISAEAYSNNVVVKSELTTKVVEGNSSVFITLEVMSSLVLLPEVPMTVRYDSPRIGYFTTENLAYSDDQQKVGNKKYITRWRLEPTDTAAYLRGELVEPVKPIVFHIDNAVPVKWRKYFEQGITDWNVAFENIGFKNAIQVVQLPDSVSAYTDDINYSTVIYAASQKQNAMGPSTIDPRSGEILEGDIIWWHNVLSLLQQWITVQTGAIDSNVRSTILPDDIMGDAVRFVLCHEVGHTLGLRHNMMGSWTIPVDSLRSKSYTDVNGTSSSIMDYARYNYVAQPNDGVTRLSPIIGAYDMLAVEYGYRWFGNKSAEQEKEDLFNLLDSHKGDLYKYSEAQSPREAVDPRAQNEDLGDNSVDASILGIENLKIIMSNVVAWTTTGEKGQTYEEASRLYYSVVNQWNNYLYHVLANIGGIYIENTTVGDGQKTFTYVEKNKQKAAVKFLLDNVFCFPKWLFDNGISDYTYLNRNTPNGVIEYAPTYILKNTQAYLFFDLLNNDRLMRMLENELVNGGKAYTAVEMMNDLHNSIFSKTLSGGKLDVMTRNIQKAFVDALITASAKEEGIKVNKKFHMEDFYDFGTSHMLCGNSKCMAHDKMGARREVSFYGSQINRTSDAISVKRGELLKIKELLKTRTSSADEATRYHYKDIIIRIDNALNIQ